MVIEVVAVGLEIVHLASGPGVVLHAAVAGSASAPCSTSHASRFPRVSAVSYAQLWMETMSPTSSGQYGQSFELRELLESG